MTWVKIKIFEITMWIFIKLRIAKKTDMTFYSLGVLQKVSFYTDVNQELL